MKLIKVAKTGEKSGTEITEGTLKYLPSVFLDYNPAYSTSL